MDKSASVTLAAGNKMPQVGFGTLLDDIMTLGLEQLFQQVTLLGLTCPISPEDIPKAVNEALDAGYHLIDTALAYGNEKSIGDTLQQRFKSGKNKREDIFVTSKVAPGLLATPDLIRKSFNRSYEALQLDYIDLYLLHLPLAVAPTPDEEPMPFSSGFVGYDHIAAWKVLEQLVDEGKVKAIGLSNFNSEQIDNIRAAARIPISNLQVECHLYLQQKELFQFCKDRNISFTSYYTFGSPGMTEQIRSTGGLPGPLNEPLVEEMAKKYKKTPGQILLRHLVQRGIAVIPKSVTPSRIKSNNDIFSFTLSQEDMMSLSDFPVKHRMVAITFMPGAKDTPGYPFAIPF